MDDPERAGRRVREEPFVPPTSIDVLEGRASSIRRRRSATIGTTIVLFVAVAATSAALVFGGGDDASRFSTRPGARGGTSTPRSEMQPCLPSRLDARFLGFARTGDDSAGIVYLTNASKVSCSLVGYPSVTMTDESGRALDVRTKQFNGRAPNNLEPNPVTLKPDSASQAAVELAWVNWCRADPGHITLSLALTAWPRPITAQSTAKNELPACFPQAPPSTLFIAPVAVFDDSGIHSQSSVGAGGANAPALDLPTGVIPCRASDLEFAPGAGLSLLRFFNRGRSCGLAGYATVSGRTATGEWRKVRTTPLDMAAVSAPRWTGVFEPSMTAVVSIRPAVDCVAGSAPTHYTALRLSLPRHEGTIDIESIQFDAGDCPLQVTPFSGDSQDN